MNKRIRKKYNKRLNCKKYSAYRSKLIERWIMENTSYNDLYIITTSKNNKHICKVIIYTNIMPAAAGLGNADFKELEISLMRKEINT